MSDKVQVEYYDVEKLKEYEKNAKVHSEEQVEKLAKSIKEHGGIANPLNIEPDGTIITGHGRRMAAIKLGFKQVPVIVRHDLNEKQRKALRLADNKTASIEYDSDILSAEIKDLNALIGDTDDDFISSLGYSTKELEMLTEDLGEVDVSAFGADFTEQVEEQQEETKEAIEQADEERVAIAKVFGFKDVSVADSRELKCFLAVIEDDTGLKGQAALMTFVKELNRS